MRTIRFFGLTLLTIIMSINFSACSDDDDEAESNNIEQLLIGTWQEEGYESFITFISNGTGLYIDEDEPSENFTWSLQGKMLISNFGDEVETDKIVKITKDIMILTDGDESGDEPYEEYTFIRVH